eukprot:9659703-Alexandrium_andersonii.AAC.1
MPWGDLSTDLSTTMFPDDDVRTFAGPSVSTCAGTHRTVKYADLRPDAQLKERGYKVNLAKK